MASEGDVLKLSASVVVHKTQVPMLVTNVMKLFSASEYLNVRVPSSVSVYIIDNSICNIYFDAIKDQLAKLEAPSNVSLHLLRLDSNNGYGEANNQVINDLKSDYHLVMNPDVGLSSDALFEAVMFMGKRKDAVLLTPAVRVGQGRLTHVAKNYPDCFTLLLRYLNFHWAKNAFSRRLDQYSMNYMSLTDSCSVDIAGGCFMFIRTAEFITVSGFDTRFFMYFEDFDLSLRVKVLGRIYYVPSIRVTHEGGDVGRKAVAHHLYFMVSAFKFFNKHGWKLF